MTENWKRWLVAMRSAHLTAVSSWDNIMDQGFDMFLNLLGETKNHPQALKKQIRDNWEDLKKGQQTQQ